jgi:hypothetical protein
LSRSKTYLGEQDAKHNVEVLQKYKYFFGSLERGICYATVLSVTQLFEDGQNKQLQTLSYLVDEAKKYKIDREEEYRKLKEKHRETLDELKSARVSYFAHRAKNFAQPNIPSSNKLYELIDDVAQLLNSIGKDLQEGGVQYWWKSEESGWKKEIQMDFQHVLNNLHRGEAARMADIKIRYERKLYNDGKHDMGE